jgi:hypothetical protein
MGIWLPPGARSKVVAMGKLVATLATTTALFAASTAYLAYRLDAVEPTRDSPATSATSLAQRIDAPRSGAAAPTAPVVRATSLAPGTTAAKTPGAPGAAVASGSEADGGRAMSLPFAKDFLRQYDDPAQRVAQLRAARGGVEAQYTRFRDRFKLDAHAFEQLVDLMAEDQLEQQATYFRCVVDPACDLSHVPSPRDRSDELLALLGADDFSNFRKYQGTLTEWQSVVQLRSRLSEANYLRDSDAGRLMKILSDEREKYVSQAAQAGANVNGWGNGSGTLWYSADGGLEEQMASAAQYAERMKGQAAAVLTAEQLRAYVQLQQEMLAGLEAYLRSKYGKPG